MKRSLLVSLSLALLVPVGCGDDTADEEKKIVINVNNDVNNGTTNNNGVNNPINNGVNNPINNGTTNKRCE